jgi:GT2 family glycosyltransferase
MNKGVKLATGEWVSFMNVGDSFYNNEALNNLLRLNHSNADILYGDVYKSDFGLINSPGKLNSFIFYDSGICHQAMLVRKSVFERIGDFDLNTKLYGDSDWVMRAFSSNVTFYHIPEIVCFYEGGGATSDNTSSSKDRRNYLIKYYSYDERMTYYFRSIINRIVYRLLRLDFRMPYFLKNLFSRPVS